MPRSAPFLLALSLLLFTACTELNPDADSPEPLAEAPASGSWICGAEPSFYDKAAPYTGMQSVAVITVEFTDTPGFFDETKKSQIASRLFTSSMSMNALYDKMTDGALGYEGGVFGPYTIDYTTTSPCNSSAWRFAAQPLAMADIPDWESYDFYVWVYPRPNDCVDGDGIGGSAGAGPDVNIFAWSSTSVYSHEFGHTLGWGHSGLPGDVYGDLTSIMSTSWAGWDLPAREAGGIWQNHAEWFPAQRVTEAVGSGVYEYDLAPTERAPGLVVDPPGGTAMQVVHFQFVDVDGDEETAYISYRRAEGPFDTLAYIQPWMNRVHVHKLDGYSQRLATLAAGESFSLGNFTVEALTDGLGGDGDDYVRARLTLIDPPPTAEVTPVRIVAGDPVPDVPVGEFQLTVTNNAAPGGLDMTYDIVPSVHAGFELIPASAQVTLAGGASGTVAVALVPGAEVADGTYPATITVNETTGTQGFAMVEVTACFDMLPPSAPHSLTAVTYASSATISWAPAVDSASMVTDLDIRRDGVIIDTVYRQLSYTDGGLQEGVPYVYEVRAWDEFGHVSDWSDPLEVVLQCREGVALAADQAIIYRDTAPRRLPFIAAFTAEVTNLNEAPCGPVASSFSFNGSMGSGFETIPDNGSTGLIGSGETVSIAVGMNFYELPGDGWYGGNLTVNPPGGQNESLSLALVIDTVAPPAPTGLTADLQGCDVNLAWSAVVDGTSGVARYEVLRGSVVVGETTGTAWVDELDDPGAGQAFAYTVRAVDNAGHVSAASAAATVTMPTVVISNVQVVHNGLDCTKTITWTTNVPASSRVFFGNDCSALAWVAQGAGNTTQHSVTCDVYDLSKFSYRVESTAGCVTATTDCTTQKRGICVSM